MTGTLINVSLIIIGGLWFQFRRRELSVENQQIIRVLIAGLVMFSGFRLIWSGLSGGFFHALGQLALIFVAMTLGNLLGMLLRIQKGMNRMAAYAKAHLPEAPNAKSSEPGLPVVAGLFCITPLAFMGAIVEGATGDYHPLFVKALMDGLATISFTRIYGLQVVLAAIPVLALQGTVTLITRAVTEASASAPTDALACTAGCLIFSVILIVFGVQQVKLGDYLPSLIVAPLLATLWW